MLTVTVGKASPALLLALAGLPMPRPPIAGGVNGGMMMPIASLPAVGVMSIGAATGVTASPSGLTAPSCGGDRCPKLCVNQSQIKRERR